MKAIVILIILLSSLLWFVIRQNENYKKNLKLIRLHEWNGDIYSIFIPDLFSSSSSSSDDGNDGNEDNSKSSNLNNDDGSSSSGNNDDNSDSNNKINSNSDGGDDDSSEDVSFQQPQKSKEDEEKERQIKKRVEEMEKQIMLAAIQSKKEENHLKELLKSSDTAAAVRAAMEEDENLIGEDKQDLEEFERQLLDSISQWEDRYDQVLSAHKRLTPKIDPKTKSFVRDKVTRLIIDEKTGEAMSEQDSKNIEINAEQVIWANHELEKMVSSARMKLGHKTLTGGTHIRFFRPSITNTHHENSGSSHHVSTTTTTTTTTTSVNHHSDNKNEETSIPIVSDQVTDDDNNNDNNNEDENIESTSDGHEDSSNEKESEISDDEVSQDENDAAGSDDTGIDVAALDSAPDVGEGGEADSRAAQAVLSSGPKSLMSESNKQTLLSQLESSESAIMKWTQVGKIVVVLGQKGYIGRDIVGYKWAFENAGFQVKRPSSGRMSTKLLASDKWSVILCLSLNTEYCFTSSSLTKTKRYQHINRLQGLRQILWSKDSFCRTLSDGTQGDASFRNYTFACWRLPDQYNQITSYAEKYPTSLFIVKPISMGGGMGISVVDGHGLTKVRHKTMIVQNYLMNPFLIKGRKWDLRTYVLVTSTYPLRVYLYSKGLVRFASRPVSFYFNFLFIQFNISKYL